MHLQPPTQLLSPLFNHQPLNIMCDLHRAEPLQSLRGTSVLSPVVDAWSDLTLRDNLSPSWWETLMLYVLIHM